MSIDKDAIAKTWREKPTIGKAILLCALGAIACFIGLAIMIRPFVIGDQNPLGLLIAVVTGLSILAVVKELILKKVPLVLKIIAYFSALMMMVGLAILSGY